MIVQVVSAFVAILAFSTVIQVPKKYLVYCGLIGAAGWLVYLLNADSKGIVMANFLAALVIALISHVFARIFKAPVTVFLIPGILVIVPGAGMYRTVYQIFLGEQQKAMNSLLQTIEIAGMIALAVFIMDSVFYMIRNKKWKKIKAE